MHSLSGIWLTSAQNFRQMDPEILPRMMWQAFEHWTTNYDKNVNYVLEELIKQVIEITTAARYLKERSMNQTWSSGPLNSGKVCLFFDASHASAE